MNPGRFKPWVQAAGMNILNQPFFARGNPAITKDYLSAQYIAGWLIARLKSIEAATEVLHYFAPVGEKDVYASCALAHIQRNHYA